ncbi:light-regulated protein [Cinnamomum micranthum f. kanehirae]|uniref:Light-regulated protein n=1 Tax=Cinnamomum micranthum f. kanehirae TaxID=337451 RepID=A0A3S3NG45_9MAGN|nr:light-regulated protein [Cinnamomum micranthum f. kanehirae]
MQSALCFPSSLPFTATTTRTSPSWKPSLRQQKTLSLPRIKAPAATPETSTVDYSSTTSVFPAEACDTVGGEACDAEMYPEVKLKAQASRTKDGVVKEEVDRDYVEYSEPKTVFPAEACDDLGGEFCEPEYQKGVYK